MYLSIKESINNVKVNAVFTALFTYYKGELCLLTVKERWGNDIGKIGLPGGKTDGEPATIAAKREWIEELGNTIIRPNIRYEPIYFEKIGKAVIFVGFLRDPIEIEKFKPIHSKNYEIKSVKWTPVYQIFMSLDGLTTWKIRPFMTLLILDITKILHLKFNTTVKQIYNRYVSNRFEITNHNFQ